MNVESRPIGALTPDPGNAREHDKKNLKAIKASLAKFGQQKPIVVDKDGMVIAGNGTLEAAKALKWGRIDVVVTELTGDDAIAFALADNKTAELARWNDEILGKSLKALKDGGFDIEAIGFDLGDVSGNTGACDPDDVPPVPPEVWVKAGDMFQLGDHRLLCGDSTNRTEVERLMNGEKADMVFTDPPYGMSVVKKDGNNNGLGETRNDGVVGVVGVAARGKYRPVIGDDGTVTAIAAYKLCVTLNVPTMIFWGANFYAEALEPSSGWIVWNKDNGEGFFADGELAWSNSDKQLRIFKHQWKGMIRESERGEKRVHPTQKPVALAEWCFENYGDPKLVLDLFLGSGSTLIACEKTNRKCYGMEIDPIYCQVILERWSKFSGKSWVKLEA